MSALGEGAEFDAIRRMLARWGPRASRIGDDAAVLDVTPEHLVVSVDASIEGRHFRREWMSPHEIGYRAVAAALSDLAASAAKPIGILLALGVPRSWQDALEGIADGAGDAGHSVGATILGGNLSGAGELSITTTVIGSARRPLTRAGATPGETLFITGALGGSGEALERMTQRRELPPEVRQRFVRPVPRIQEALWLRVHGATAGIDVSDGLAADLGHLAAASKVRLEVDLRAIPTFNGVEPLAAAASGEEYEVIVTAPRTLDTAVFTRQFGIPLTAIGRVEGGPPDVALLEEGRRVAVPSGHDHFLR